MICKGCSVTNVRLPGTIVQRRACRDCADKVERQERQRPGPPPMAGDASPLLTSPTHAPRHAGGAPAPTSPAHDSEGGPDGDGDGMVSIRLD